jgi:hypothetical protein
MQLRPEFDPLTKGQGQSRAVVKERLREIERLLWEDWDPIGMRSSETAQSDEYDSYAGHVYRLAAAATSTTKIEDYLTSVQLDGMGLQATPRLNQEIAERALAIINGVSRNPRAPTIRAGLSRRARSHPADTPDA